VDDRPTPPTGLPGRKMSAKGNVVSVGPIVPLPIFLSFNSFDDPLDGRYRSNYDHLNN